LARRRTQKTNLKKTQRSLKKQTFLNQRTKRKGGFYMSQSKEELVENLACEILRHKALYYEGFPEISDHEYDALEEKLRAFDPHHKVLNLIGFESKSGSKNKRKHKTPMLSLAKTYDAKELFSWQKEKEIVATHKIDGNSLSLIYKKGELVLAKTRGNGEEGEDVTGKILWVSECPKKLQEKSLKDLSELNFTDDDEIEVRGELYCLEEEFPRLAEKMITLGLPEASSPRNIVAGILSRKNHIHLARYFNFFAFEVIFRGSSPFFKTEMNKISWLKGAGFSYPPYKLLLKENDIQDYLSALKEEIDSHSYGIDGAVFNFNDLTCHETLGETAHHPRYKISFKWQGETGKTKIQKIIWSTSRFGTVTPVAQVEPTHLSDAIITNVTLHNLAHVKLFKLKAHDEIEIVRSGEVIPKFLRVIKQNPGEALIPKECPSCGSELIEENIRLVCENNLCGARVISKILNWIKQAQIDDLSEKRLMSLIEARKVSHIEDLYKLKKEDFLELPMTKEKLATKLIHNIEGSKKLSLVNFLCALGIEGAGKATWAHLTKVFPTLEDLLKATSEDLMSLDGFAEKTAEQITKGLKENKSLMEKLFALGVEVEKRELHHGQAPLEGLVFVLTGAFSRPREEIAEYVQTLGAKVSSSVTKKTTALVSDDFSKKSSKTIKAESLGVPMWSGDELSNFIKQKLKEGK